jgi:hypothetical protein
MLMPHRNSPPADIARHPTNDAVTADDKTTAERVHPTEPDAEDRLGPGAFDGNEHPDTTIKNVNVTSTVPLNRLVAAITPPRPRSAGFHENTLRQKNRRIRQGTTSGPVHETTQSP